MHLKQLVRTVLKSFYLTIICCRISDLGCRINAESLVSAAESLLHNVLISRAESLVSAAESCLCCRILSLLQNLVSAAEFCLCCRILSLLQNFVSVAESVNSGAALLISAAAFICFGKESLIFLQNLYFLFQIL